jgi:hypothetical protein
MGVLNPDFQTRCSPFINLNKERSEENDKSSNRSGNQD